MNSEFDFVNVVIDRVEQETMHIITVYSKPCPSKVCPLYKCWCVPFYYFIYRIRTNSFSSRYEYRIKFA